MDLSVLVLSMTLACRKLEVEPCPMVTTIHVQHIDRRLDRLGMAFIPLREIWVEQSLSPPRRSDTACHEAAPKAA